MKKIFSYIYIISALIVVLSFQACKKFLDQQPVSQASEQAVFENSNTALQALLGVYNRLCGVNYGLNISLVFPFDTDEMIGYSAGAVTDAQRSLNAYDLTATNSNLSPVFTRLYSGIERANICIYNIPLMPGYTNGAESEKQALARLYGEALTLRALFYSELIKFWGDVPASYAPAIQLTNFDLPKTDRDSIYDHIIEDLRIASELVPWRGESGVAVDERITKGAVKALRARIALFRGGYSLRRETRTMERRPDSLKFYQIAKDECFDIMQRQDIHKLNPSFQAVWQDAILANTIEPNGEVLFEVAMAGEGDADSRLGTWNGIRVITNGTSFGNYRNFIMPTMLYAFSPYDLRRDVSAAPFTITNSNYTATTLAGVSDGKWRRDWITPAIPLNEGKTYYGLNWPIIRFSDVLLMYAEAENELTGPTAEAVEAVNQVRRRSWAVDAVKNVTIDNGGTGYTSIPTVTFSGGGGSGARAVARINDGAVTSIDMISLGSNYTSAPAITVSGGGGSGFSGTVTLTSINDADLTVEQTADKSSFLKAIQDERLYEFVSEGIRKWDLIRWNLLGTKLAETKAQLQKMINREAPYDVLPLRMFYQNNSTGSLVWGNSLYAPVPAAAPSGYTAVNWIQAIAAGFLEKFAASFTPNKSEIFPIPQNVIEASHGAITQDFGY
ncbi:MAG: RagB/SusD family nutrient uptake outer membrane protein [Niabella sp.]